MRISDWSSDVCSSDLLLAPPLRRQRRVGVSSGIAANRDYPLPASPCLRRGRSLKLAAEAAPTGALAGNAQPCAARQSGAEGSRSWLTHCFRRGGRLARWREVPASRVKACTVRAAQGWALAAGAEASQSRTNSR